MKDRDELRKQIATEKVEQNKLNEAQQARYEALTNRVVTALEGNTKANYALVDKIDSFASTEKLRAEIAQSRADVLDEIRDTNAKGPDSRRQ